MTTIVELAEVEWILAVLSDEFDDVIVGVP
jgi:hypothetical protein